MTNESNHQLLINVIQSALAENRENGDRPRFGAGPNQTSFVESMLQYLCSYLDSEDDWKTGSAQPNIMNTGLARNGSGRSSATRISRITPSPIRLYASME